MEEINKFEEAKPLLVYPPSHYAAKYLLKYNNFEAPKETSLHHFMMGKPVEEKPYKLVFGIKAFPEEFTKYDFLDSPDGPAFVVHGRVVDKLKELCPEDFQAFPIDLKNYDPKDEPFLNHDFYLINITHEVEAIDKEKSLLIYDDAEDINWFYVKKLVLKENCMKGHLLARDKDEHGEILFHPSLAKKFRRSKGIQFLSDVETHAYS